MGIVYWQDSSETFQLATNMQAIALDQALWQSYMSCATKGRDIFRQCAGDDIEWSVHTVLAYADYEDNPPQTVAKSTEKPVAVKPAFIPGRTKEEDTNATKFIAWMFQIALLVKSDTSLAYSCGTHRVLSDGTISVPVAVKRGKTFFAKVSFVFHYHPGVKGAGVGSTEGSKWHFKPFDGAKKWVRVADHQFSKLDGTMVTSVKEIAKKKK